MHFTVIKIIHLKHESDCSLTAQVFPSGTFKQVETFHNKQKEQPFSFSWKFRLILIGWRICCSFVVILTRPTAPKLQRCTKPELDSNRDRGQREDKEENNLKVIESMMAAFLSMDGILQDHLSNSAASALQWRCRFFCFVKSVGEDVRVRPDNLD